jgi:acyl carrier protein|tara:strand:+ start:1290 stop:1538 length:249 start_codon:yes stop_codon:yes gene_type:complete
MTEIQEQVIQVVSQQLNVDVGRVKPDSRLTEDLGADSLDAVELVMALEEAFKIEIPDDEAEKIKTIQNCIEYIEKIKNKSSI